MLRASWLLAMVVSLIAIAGVGGGCTHYEYDVVRPQENAGHVGTKPEYVFQRDVLEYRLITIDNRLVMRVANNTDDAVQLVGERSSVVDPKGESHPLRSIPIAPHSNVKLIFPPLRPVVERRGGPSFGIGIGTRVGSAYDARHRFRDDDPVGAPWYDEPRYFAVVEDDVLYWDWDGEGEIRLSLVFQRGEQTFTHEFVIRRAKV